MQQKRFWKQAAAGLTFLAIGTAFAATADDDVTMPSNFESWQLANSMLVTKAPNKFGLVTGNHLIHINATGVDRLKTGGSSPYPDGSIFVDDIHDFTLDDGAYVEGRRTAVPVMVKDSRKYAATGGWGFQAFTDGDPAKPIVTNAVTQCFTCHMPQKANDYVFSTYLK